MNNNAIAFVERIIYTACKQGISDVHIYANKAVYVRKDGKLMKTETNISENDMLAFLVKYNFAKANVPLISQPLSCDVAFELGVRIRGHYYLTDEGPAVALRLLSDHIPSFENLSLPERVVALHKLKRGLILISGVTGSGKSTTLASIVNEINKTRNEHIITIEDPIEYKYTSINSKIDQREVKSHVETFPQAVKDAMRADPDVIVLGEMRDIDTIQTAITLAETGHLVLATVHADSAVGTFDRIVDVFPAEKQRPIRMQLANILQAALHQTLLPRNGGGRIPLIELMYVTSAIRNLLKNPDCKPEQVRDTFRTAQSEELSLHRVDEAKRLVSSGLVSAERLNEILTIDDYKQLIKASGKEQAV